MAAKSLTVQLQPKPQRSYSGSTVMLEARPSQPGVFRVVWAFPATIRGVLEEMNLTPADREDVASWLHEREVDDEFARQEGWFYAVNGPAVHGPDDVARIRIPTGGLELGAYEAAVLMVAEDPEGFEAELERIAPEGSKIARAEARTFDSATTAFVVEPRPFQAGDQVNVKLGRTDVPKTPDQSLYTAIRNGSLTWARYAPFIDEILCPPETGTLRRRYQSQFEAVSSKLSLPFPDADSYRLLKVATEVFMMVNCGVFFDSIDGGESVIDSVDFDAESRRYGRKVTREDVMASWGKYLTPTDGYDVLPYYGIIRRKLRDVDISANGDEPDGFYINVCYNILRSKLTMPCFLELIWSYWHEEGMLVQTMNAISRRFQNMRAPGDRDPLAHVEIDPLRPLNNFLWGYIQDEQHRLSVVRRAYEYDHHYGLTMLGKAVPTVRGADSRSRFLEAFHNLMMLCSIFYKEDDDTTVIADGFPILNALREVHLILTQGAHNQYGDLPWTARHEMLMQEWLLARPEMRDFLPSRVMVAYPEPWMDRVEAMKTLQGWSDVSVMHFRDLGVFGEQILLGIRFNNWTDVIEPDRAANWARYWRPEIQGYVHAYRAVTGADLTEQVDATMPSLLLRRRAPGLSQQPQSGRPQQQQRVTR